MDKLRKKLSEREINGNLRRLTCNHNLTDFFSNDYLGLARSKELSENIYKEYTRLSGNINGATGSRLLSGNSPYFINIEEKLAALFKTEKSLVFNSGYDANVSLLSSVPQKDDTILYDELIHASLKEGARLSFAKRFSFRHNDLADLESKIKKASGDVFVVVESIYSMDGDYSPLVEIIRMCEKYKAYLVLDEAHSTGILGEGGHGLACKLGIENKIFARVHTFGKAMGVHGACICGSSDLINYLINFARPFIYTTALPLHSLVAISQAFDFVGKHMELQREISGKIKLFKSEFAKKPLFKAVIIESDSPIQVLKVSGNKEAKSLSAKLVAGGFDVRPILSPTVKKGEERLRICLHVFNSEEEIKKLVASVSEVLVKQDLSYKNKEV
jgi:8-amino-7-oxononanoate synthase